MLTKVSNASYAGSGIFFTPARSLTTNREALVEGIIAFKQSAYQLKTIMVRGRESSASYQLTTICRSRLAGQSRTRPITRVGKQAISASDRLPKQVSRPVLGLSSYLFVLLYHLDRNAYRRETSIQPFCKNKTSFTYIKLHPNHIATTILPLQQS